MVRIFPNDVIITSEPLINEFFSRYNSVELNYKTFSEIVAQAVDSVERKKYGCETFCDTVSTLIRNHNIPSNEVVPIELSEEVNYKGFSCSVSKLFFKTFDEEDDDYAYEVYEGVFDSVNSLIDEYNIPRAEVPKQGKYGGQPLKKDFKSKN